MDSQSITETKRRREQEAYERDVYERADENYIREYDARRRAEIQEKRKYRDEMLSHRDNVRICNWMLALEGVVLVSLIVALILQFV